MTATVTGGTAVLRSYDGGKMAVVNLHRQTVEIQNSYGGRKHFASFPLDMLINLVDPQGTTYRKVDVHF